MYAKPYDRKFGIEFEFGCRGISDRGPSNYYEDNRSDNFRRLLSENGMSDFILGRDGSEWEIKTPPLSGPNGFKKVKKFLELIDSLGAYVSLEADGLHVHHDAPEFIDNADATVRLVKNWYENQDEITKMVNPVRYARGSCPLWTEEDVQRLEIEVDRNVEHAIYRYGRKNLNVSALRRHGTIEIRLHEGTLNYEEVLSWVRFGQAFIAKAIDETESVLERMPTPNDLLKEIKVSRNASRFITSKVQTYDSARRRVNRW